MASRGGLVIGALVVGLTILGSFIWQQRPVAPIVTPTAATRTADERDSAALPEAIRLPGEPAPDQASPIQRAGRAPSAALEAGRPSALIAVREESGEPVEGVWIALEGDDLAEVQLATDDDGIGRSRTPPTALRAIHCRRSGFLATSVAGPFAAAPIAVTLERAAGPCVLRFDVRGSENQRIAELDWEISPRSGAAVELMAWRDAKPVRPRFDGEAHVAKIDGAWGGAPLFVTARAADHLPSHVEVTAPPPGETLPVEIRLAQPLRRLRGVVVAARDGTPVAGALVSANAVGARWQETGSDGRFDLAEIDGAQARLIEVRCDGFALAIFESSRFEALLVGDELRLPLEESSGEIEVSARDSNGVPLAEIPISACFKDAAGDRRELRGGRTDSSGRVTLRGLPRVPLEVWRSQRGSDVQCDLQPIDLSDVIRTRVDFVVRDGATLPVKARCQDLADLAIELLLFELGATGESGALVARDTLSSECEFSGLRPGRYLLRAFSPPGQVDRVVEVRTGRNERVQLDFTLQELFAVAAEDHSNCRDEAHCDSSSGTR